jgi:hypothetical protein
MEQFIVALLVLGSLGAFYAVTYALNHKIPVPEGCEELQSTCAGCNIHGCGNHPSSHS